MGYAELTIRELLRVVDALLQIWTNNDYAVVRSNLGRELWAVYGARFRTPSVRASIVSIIGACCSNDATTASYLRSSGGSINITADKLSFNGVWKATRTRIENDSWWDELKLPENIKAVLVSRLNILHSKAFIAAHGLYSITRSELREWAKANVQSTSENACISSVEFFTRRLRSVSAAEAFVARDAPMSHSVGKAPVSPFVLGPRQLFFMNLLLRSVVLRQPVLLVGFTGCGKSELVLALASLLGQEIIQLCLTAETDPSDVVGSVAPETLAWHDGPVSEAVSRDCWVLLDNLQEVLPCALCIHCQSQAEAVVLERLNPLLESPPLWHVAENNEERPREIKKHFHVFATLTCSEKVLLFQSCLGLNQGNRKLPDLSPALANRFNIIWMDDIVDDQDQDSSIAELKMIFEAYSGVLNSFMFLFGSMQSQASKLTR